MRSDRYALSAGVAIALLAGCGGSQPPIGAPGAMSQTFSHAAHADRGTSWMLPGAKGDDLLYVTNSTFEGKSFNVLVFSYSKGALVGTLAAKAGAEPTGSCSDPNGDVWITDYGSAQILEYAHGSKEPRATLKAAAHPIGCAIDLLTGDLAVANYGPPGGVSIYRHARGKARFLNHSEITAYFFCTYDLEGNLFVDGQTDQSSDRDFRFAEIPRGTSRIEVINPHLDGASPGQVQWYGKYLVLALQNESDAAVFQFQISGRAATLAHIIELGDVDVVSGFTIYDSRLIVASDGSYDRSVPIFDYPAGGGPRRVITSSIDYPLDVALSFAPH